MAVLVQYRYKCITEDKFIFEWREAHEPIPTLCKNNHSDSIIAGSVTKVDERSESEVVVVPKEGGGNTIPDGVSLSLIAGQWARIPCNIGESIHIQGVFAQWTGMLEGDYAFTVVNNPSAEGNLAVAANAGDTQVDVGATLVPFYDPNLGAVKIEFWDVLGNLLEVYDITGISGNFVQFDGTLLANRDTTTVIRCRIGDYQFKRGAGNIEGGLRMIDKGSFALYNLIGKTTPIPSGMELVTIVKASAAIGTRLIAVNYIFREPSITTEE